MRRLLLGGALLIATTLLIALWATNAPDPTSDAASSAPTAPRAGTSQEGTTSDGSGGGSGASGSQDGTNGTASGGGTSDDRTGSSTSGRQLGNGAENGAGAVGGTGANRSSVGGWSPADGSPAQSTETGVTIVKAIPFAITNTVGGLPLPPTGGGGTRPGGGATPTTTQPPAVTTTTTPPPSPTIVPANPNVLVVTASPSQAFGGATQTISLKTDSGSDYHFASCSGSDYLSTAAGFVDAGFRSRFTCADPTSITRTLGSDVPSGVYAFCAQVTNGAATTTACTPYLVR